MKTTYFDNIKSTRITVEVNAKVKHFLDEQKQNSRSLTPAQVSRLSQRQQEIYKQRQFEKHLDSLDELLDAGFQPTDDKTVEDELIRRHREMKYLHSRDYKKFHSSLQKEIKKANDSMPDYIRQVMFLRFFKDMSIGQIARELGVRRGTVQDYLSRGTSFIKDFLEKDIREQNKIHKRAIEKRRMAALKMSTRMEQRNNKIH